MPVDRRVHAAQQKIIHWVINNGYSIRKGGLGTVRAIATEQLMLRAHAVISKTKRTGHSL